MALERYITSQAHFYQRDAEKEAAAFSAMVPGNFADFPASAADQCALVDQMMTAMEDTTDILDNLKNDAHINCIRAKADDEVEEKAWKVMRVPKLLTAYFPNFMDRWEALVALMRHSKTAVADLFAIHYMDRYVHNPVTELDTKLSNDYTNKMRDFNKDVKAASRFRSSVTTVDRITSIYDAAGNLSSTATRALAGLADGADFVVKSRLVPTFGAICGITNDKPTFADNSWDSGQSLIQDLKPDCQQDLLYDAPSGACDDIVDLTEDDQERLLAVGESDLIGGNLISRAIAVRRLRNELLGLAEEHQGTKEGTVGEVERDNGHQALEGPNDPSTPSPDAVNPHFDSRYSTPVQHLTLSEQSHIDHKHSTPDQNQPLGDQPEQPSPNGRTAPPKNELDADHSPFFAEAYHEPIDSYDGEDVSSQVALDGRIAKYGNNPYDIDHDWYEL
ncbi:hypothetical protein B0T13DRAFT_523947 [Neurospora crassa]|nr:hypothetical protein B0T13DRAFT_523947 [Neurospora crassa]